MIFLTGDTHSHLDIEKLNEDKFVEGNNLTKNDYLIILGDFGFIWDNFPNRKELHWLEWFDNKPWTTLFLDGNHENFNRLEEFPVSEWNGGKVQQISKTVYHLMRGQIYNIDNKTFLTMGGAESYDKLYRTPDVSWWEQEIPNRQEIEECLSNIQKVNGNVDYILTHTCVSKLVPLMVKDVATDPTCKFLDEVDKLCNYKKWFFGHWHIDRDFKEYKCLYQTIEKLT